MLHFAASSLAFAVTTTPYSAKSADGSSGKFWARATTLKTVSETKQHPLQALIGGPRGAIESILPPLAFITTYVATGDNMTWAVSVAVGLGLFFAIWRLVERKRPTRVLGALLVVVLSAYIAAKSGSAAAFFWPRVLLNVASALAFAISIFIRWPLLGVIVGPIVGTKMRWRQDPDLMRAYNRASWLWVLLCVIRAAVLIPLIENNWLWALAASGALFYALVIVTVLLSWVVIKRTLPADHPGIRAPRVSELPSSS